jgi:hypothetical protein
MATPARVAGSSMRFGDLTYLEIRERAEEGWPSCPPDAPSVNYLQRAWEDCEQGRPSRRLFMEAYIQSATEDGLAPEGKHTMSLFCQYAPYTLAAGSWEERLEEIGANIIETFAEFTPNTKEAIEHVEVVGPPDIEERIGIIRGNIFHGEITPDQMFEDRPQLRRLLHAGQEPLPVQVGRPVRRSSGRRAVTAPSRCSPTWRRASPVGHTT